MCFIHSLRSLDVLHTKVATSAVPYDIISIGFGTDADSIVAPRIG